MPLLVVLGVSVAGAAELELPVFTDVTEEAGNRGKSSKDDFTPANIVAEPGAGARFFC